MNPIHSMIQFVYMIHQVQGELDDLHAAIEYDEEFMDGALGTLESLEKEMRSLDAKIRRGLISLAGKSWRVCHW